jgi:hypothetical protein
MPHEVAMLTDVAVRNAKPKGKPFKLADERALYLLVRPRLAGLSTNNCD